MKSLLIETKNLSSDFKQQIIDLLAPSWVDPEKVFNYWLKKIDFFLLIVKNQKVLAIGSWSIHGLQTHPFQVGVLLALYAVSKQAQGKGLGTKVTLLSYIYAYKQVYKLHGNKRVVFWGTSANPIVIHSYHKHFPLYKTPFFDNKFDESYLELAMELRSRLGLKSENADQNPFLLKSLVSYKFTEAEYSTQEDYIKKLGNKFKIDLKIRQGDRLLLILADIKSPLVLLSLYSIHFYLSLRNLFKENKKA